MSGKNRDRDRERARLRYERSRARKEAARAKARRRNAMIGSAAGAVAIILLVVWVAGGFDGKKKDTTSAQSQPGATTSPTADPTATEPATAPAASPGCTFTPPAPPSPAVADFPKLPAGTDKALETEPSITVAAGPAPDQLVSKDLVEGTGAVVGADDTVTVNYVGVHFTNCEEFDSSWSKQQEVTFSLNGVIVGWKEGLTGMKVGGRRELTIPASLAYGAAGQGAIGPNETLVFVVDMLDATAAS